MHGQVVQLAVAQPVGKDHLVPIWQLHLELVAFKGDCELQKEMEGSGQGGCRGLGRGGVSVQAGLSSLGPHLDLRARAEAQVTFPLLFSPFAAVLGVAHDGGLLEARVEMHAQRVGLLAQVNYEAAGEGGTRGTCDS